MLEPCIPSCDEENGRARLDSDERLTRQLQAHVASCLADFPTIADLPDLTTVQGFVTGPVWRDAPAKHAVAHHTFAGVVDHIGSADELRILADRGYFTRENYRQAWAMLLERGAVQWSDLLPEDAVRFGYSPDVFAFFQVNQTGTSGWCVDQFPHYFAQFHAQS